jgi:hypothetical protein
MRSKITHRFIKSTAVPKSLPAKLFLKHKSRTFDRHTTYEAQAKWQRRITMQSSRGAFPSPRYSPPGEQCLHCHEHTVANPPNRGDAHPHVTNCPAVHKGFKTLDEARAFMKENKVFTPKEVIRQIALCTTSQKCGKVYYAIANGADVGIREDW